MRTVCHPLRRLRGNDEGQAAFEFMLVLPIFILFILMTVDFGVLMYEYVSVSNAAREGARYGAVNCSGGTSCSTTTIKDWTVSRSGGILSDSDTVDVGWLDNDDANTTKTDRGDSIVVHITHPYAFLFFPYNMDVKACADMRLEQTKLPTGSVVTGTRC